MTLVTITLKVTLDQSVTLNTKTPFLNPKSKKPNSNRLYMLRKYDTVK